MNLDIHADPLSASGVSGSKRNPSRLRRWMLNVHLYGGLLSFWYLLIYGFTSLAFNHPGLVPSGEGGIVKWERAISVPDGTDDLRFGEAVRDQLKLIGWVIPWNMRRDSAGNLHFELSRPGKKYFIVTDRAAGVARIEEQGTGLRSALHFLHGSTGGVPGSAFLGYWGWYTEITNWLVLFFVGSGIYLWTRRVPDRRAALAVLGGGLLLSSVLMACLYLVA